MCYLYSRLRSQLFIALVLISSLPLDSADIVSLKPLHDRLLVLHYTEGSVDWHGAGESRNDDVVTVDPINVAAAIWPKSYFFRDGGPAIVAVGRKSNPSAVTTLCEGWGFLEYYQTNGCINTSPDRVIDHYLYLRLAQPLEEGKTYTLVVTAGVDGEEQEIILTFDSKQLHSEALHVNNLGYSTAAPQRFGYLYHWAGDLGAQDFGTQTGQPFHLLREGGGVAFSGTIAYRKSRFNADTYQNGETPNNNFAGADVWECDFSDFAETGTYRLHVPGVGVSFPFDIKDGALREAYRAGARSLYHNRSGIAKVEPYTTFTRPADHNPELTPGFAGRLIYSDFTVCAASTSEGRDVDRASYEAGARGSLENTWGWYHDAGDWDAYPSHLRVPSQLLFTYEFFPNNFADEQLNIPESGNGLPDIVDEGRWLLRFYKRLKDETEAKGWTTGGVGGARVFGDLWGADTGPGDTGRGSWEDTDRDWYVSGEDPVNTFAYAGMAAHLASTLRELNLPDPENIDWEAEARAAYTWADARYAADFACHEYEIAEKKNYAAAALYRLTGENSYHEGFKSSWADVDSANGLTDDAGFGAYAYLSLPQGQTDGTVRSQVLAAVTSYADQILVQATEQRALRYGGNLFFPMLVGQPTTPMVWEGVAAYALIRDDDPDRAESYLAGLYTTADYFLGANPLNITWMTGLGERPVEELFHLDSWYDGHPGFPAGYVPYGPWRRSLPFNSVGYWDVHWAEPDLYPGINAWPGHARWFGERATPLKAEFTIHQNLVVAATVYGALAGPLPQATSTTEIADPASQDAQTLAGNIVVSPNPTGDLFRLQLPTGLPAPESIRLLSAEGRLLEMLLPGAPEYALRNYAAGTYLLTVEGPGYQRTLRIVRPQ